MIDINKKNNFEQLPPLKQKCDPNVAAKPIQSNSNKTTDIASRISRNYIGDQIRINAQLNARKTASPNAVCIANQNFFLVSAFKDQNFLKKECELARSQVVSKANSNEPQLESSGSHGDGASVSCHNEDMINNNNNNTAISETKPQSTLIKGRRISNGHQMRTSPIPSLIANGSAVGIANTYNVLPKITKVPSCNTKLKAIQPTDGYRTTTRVTSSTGSKALMNQSSGPAKSTQKASTVRSASRIIPNNNNMQHQQCLDLHDEDIKYIDSDEVITNAESSSMNCQQRCCSQQVEQQELSGKPKARPKSTIICSTNQKNQMFEKVNSYKFAAGTSLADVNARNGIDAVGSVERRRLTKTSIDSSSIKASIEKFNSLSEQKRIPLSTNPLRTQTSGCGSTSNLQHHRYSSDFSDNHNVRLPSSVIGGGSLTRTTSRSVAAASPVNKVVTNLYATASSSSTSASPVTVKTRLYSVGNQSNASTRINGVCNNKSTESSPTHMPPKVLNRYDRLKDIKDNDNDGNFVSPNSVPAVVNGKESPATSKTDAADIAESNENRLLNSSCDIDDSARSSSSLRSALPPPSPTPSRYWDRESNRTSSLSRSEDQSKSEKCDEKAEGLCGLRNIGNTCFMNSVIQCLSHTSELTKFLKTQNGVKSSSSSKDQQILYEFAKLIREMWTTNVHSVTPMELKRAFSTKHRMYSDYNQQDAQEFLRFFLDSLHGALNTGVKGEHLKIDDNLSDNKKADLTWEWYARHENSLIRDLFVGQLKSTLKCTTCGNTSVTFDPFWDLSVSLPSSSRCKLDACLDLFIREEILDGDEMPTCSKCQTRRKCTKSFSIQRFPKYLVIHLKRFSETRWSKLSNIVEFPTGEKELNMGPYGSNHNSNVYYSLYAISNHMGSTAGGHYVALCKHPVSKKWHEFNDNIVSDDLSENHLVSSSAYILFYERA